MHPLTHTFNMEHGKSERCFSGRYNFRLSHSSVFFSNEIVLEYALFQVNCLPPGTRRV